MTRRDWWLGVVSMFVGPLVGGLTFIAAVLAVDGIVSGTPPASNFLLRDWPFVLTVGYVCGIIPGLAFAIAMALLSRRIPRLLTRLATGAMVGALAGIMLLYAVALGTSLAGIDLTILLCLGLTGASAGVVSLALVELFHPLPAPAKPAG